MGRTPKQKLQSKIKEFENLREREYCGSVLSQLDRGGSKTKGQKQKGHCREVCVQFRTIPNPLRHVS